MIQSNPDLKPYYDIAKFSEYYLEDSFVLEIVESGNELRFELDLVLRAGHPKYKAPDLSKMYSYKRGRLVFWNIKKLEWTSRFHVRSSDANGTFDMGNIDIFLVGEHGLYILAGDWGNVSVKSEFCDLLLE